MERQVMEEEDSWLSAKVLSNDIAPSGCYHAKKSAIFRDGHVIPFVMFVLDMIIAIVAYRLVVAALSAFGAQSSFNVWTLITITVPLIMIMIPIGAYGRKVDFVSIGYACQHMMGFVIMFVLGVVTIFYIAPETFSQDRRTYIPTLALVSVFTLLLRRLIYRIMLRASGERILLVVGYKEQTDNMQYWMSVVRSRYTLFYVNPETGLVNGSNQKEINLVGATIRDSISRIGDDLEAIVLVNPADLSAVFQKQLVAINFNIMPVYMLESFYARNWHVVPLSTLSALWAFEKGFNLSQNLVYVRLKRAEDMVLSVLALLILSPVFLLVALAVRLDSPGPIIFRQKRVGLMGRKFTLYKFRSMCVGSEKGGSYTEEKDSRVTRIGGFLRITRLDEIPQFINVLRGDMSLIGPRAEWDLLVEEYEKKIPFYNFRHLVKPGITGWAQVNYRYGMSVDDTRIKLRYDLYYVKYFSFMMDLTIISKTVYVMLFGKGR